jgi:V-type H+-transporting ATPase subunit H
MYPSTVSPSPVYIAFLKIEWNDPVSLSSPELTLLQNAEENPLEYTIAEYDDAYRYARLLLKLLDQVTGPTQPGILSEVQLEAIPFDEDKAYDYLRQDKSGVISHYLITKLYELIHLLSQEPTQQIQIATIFFANQQLVEDWRPLLRLLYRQGDAFAQRNASLCMAYLLRAGCDSHWPMENSLQSLITWITSRLQSSHSADSLSVVTPSLCVLAGCLPARTILDQAGGIGYLSRHLRLFILPTATQQQKKYNIPSIQQVYEICFCIWSMTFDLTENVSIQQSFVRGGAIHALCQLLSLAPREKVVRLALATLHNLAAFESNQQQVYLGEMIAANAQKYVEQMQERTTWSDPDCLEDLTALHPILQRHARELTRWNVYQAELESGQLSWGMLHTEEFFKEHIRQMEGPKGDFEPVKKLLSLLMQNLHTDDDEALAICLFDIGEFSWQYPNGRAIAKRLGIRQIVLQLLDHPSPKVQGHALQCVSKLLIQHNWRVSHYILDYYVCGGRVFISHRSL